MRNVIDTASPQRNLNLALPLADGFRDVYVKMGGDNVDPTYQAPYYEQQVNAAWALGYEHVGHYWVPNSDPSDADTIDTPTQQSEFMLSNLHGWDRLRSFIVLDNENLDGAIRFDDAGAAEFISHQKMALDIPGRQTVFYTNLSDARAHPWPQLLATGCMFIIAAPSYAPGQYPIIPTIPADRIIGHQYGTRTWGGVVTDVNVFRDDAFEFGGPTMSYVNVDGWRVILIDGVRDPNVSWAEHIARGSAGGVDCVAVVGTPLHAPAAGRIEFAFNNGSGGHTATLHQAGGWRDQFMHLSAFEGAGGRDVQQGELIGYTGNTVAPGYSPVAQHLHWHRIDPSGVRRNPWNYFTAGSGTAGGGYNPIEEDDMFSDTDRADLQVIKTGLGLGGLAPNGLASPDTILGISRELRTRTRNIDKQTTGADGFAPSIASRVIALQAAVTALAGGTGIDPVELERIIGEAVAANAPTIAELLDAGFVDDFDGIRAALAQLPDDVRENIKAAL
jgi:hypothetical protein